MTDKKLTKRVRKRITRGLYEAIVDEEDYEPNPEYVLGSYVDDKHKTIKMLELEKELGQRIESILNREPWCENEKAESYCLKRNTACLFHLGIKESTIVMWKRMLGMLVHRDKRVQKLFRYFQELSELAESREQLRIPVVINRRELKLLVQVIASVPEEAKFE